jgi:threonine dehydrogenase-like Zn-dependent dehydrogenase
MKAVCWYGAHDVRVDDVAQPKILNPHDALVKITLSAICGSDLHLYDGYIPTMRKGDILGHEFMGVVVEVGAEVQNLRAGDRVVVPFPIACGRCQFCQRQEYALCDNSNPNAWMAEQIYGYTGAAIFGYSHLYGGYAGGQAEFARVPFADVGPVKVPESLSDEQVLFLSDIIPTGWQAAGYCNIQPGDVVAVWGCGPVGLFALLSAKLLGAERVIAIDRVPERLEMARVHTGAEIIDYERTELYGALQDMTGGRGPDACIDSVGLEAHGTGLAGTYDKTKHLTRMETDRPTALRQAVQACRKGGTISIPGVYSGFIDKFNIGAAFAKGLTFKMGQTHVQKYMPELLDRIEKGEIDPTFLITHRLPLEEAPRGYELFRNKEENCVKVVLKPGTVH